MMGMEKGIEIKDTRVIPFIAVQTPITRFVLSLWLIYFLKIVRTMNQIICHQDMYSVIAGSTATNEAWKLTW